MGLEPGVDSGYEHGPAAVVGGVPTADRKITNHFFAGPDYPIIHPGIFPHRAGAIKEESEKPEGAESPQHSAVANRGIVLEMGRDIAIDDNG